MLRKLLGDYPAKALYLVVLFLSVVGFGTVALAQAVEPFSNTIYAFFSDPVLFSSVVVAITPHVVSVVTNGIKDKTKIKGWHTTLLAATVAALLAGVGGALGLSYFTDLSGLQGAYTGAGLAFASWLYAEFRHGNERLNQTGQRKHERGSPAIELPKNAAELFDLVAKTDLPIAIREQAVEVLKGLNPVMGLAAEALLDQIATRPLDPDESKAERDAELERRTAAAHD